jgi:hypothetical protein
VSSGLARPAALPPRTAGSSLTPRLCPALAAVKQRIRAIKNIGKITKAMKMVAASKMRNAQVAVEESRGVVSPFIRLFGEHPGALLLQAPPPGGNAARGISPADADAAPPHHPHLPQRWTWAGTSQWR